MNLVELNLDIIVFYYKICVVINNKVIWKFLNIIIDDWFIIGLMKKSDCYKMLIV